MLQYLTHRTKVGRHFSRFWPALVVCNFSQIDTLSTELSVPINRGSLSQVNGVRNNKNFSARRFTKRQPSPIIALGFGEPYFLVASSNSPFPLVVTIVKSYEEKRFAALGGIHVGMIHRWIRNERLTTIIQPIIFASFTLATVIDLMITSAMYYYLNKSQSSFVGWVASDWCIIESIPNLYWSFLQRTKNKILIIMRYVLLTGALTR